MRFLFDENVPIDLIFALVKRGHDCIHGAITNPSVCDSDVLKRACAENRILVSFDSDFARMIFRERATAPTGIVYMQSRPKTASLVIDRFVSLFHEKCIDIIGKFLIVDEGGPIRSLPIA